MTAMIPSCSCTERNIPPAVASEDGWCLRCGRFVEYVPVETDGFEVEDLDRAGAGPAEGLAVVFIPWDAEVGYVPVDDLGLNPDHVCDEFCDPPESDGRPTLEGCVCGRCFDCPDGWHYGLDLPCSCTPECAAEDLDDGDAADGYGPLEPAPDYGGVFDGLGSVYSDADPGL